MSASENKPVVTLTISARQGSYNPPARSLVLKVHAQRNLPQAVELNGRTLAAPSSIAALDAATEGWAYDDAQNVVWIKTPDRGAALTARIEK